ncbi:protein sip5 [Anaeramoeba flamelloides]|uniref:Protein sip5 n=1 Tax=Anaeramoeba flamelloides TaxID=1746091 RepID=A0AAV7YW94_9EUKA|nr:protein sip5 [Anaeramoeba flamelloides]KAJ6246684.1 protein sip5 [Anaeramoeba flamelloides]
MGTKNSKRKNKSKKSKKFKKNTTEPKITLKKASKKYFVPTYEIYPSIRWSKRRIKKLIKKKKLAPIFHPEDDPTETFSIECLICNYFFPITNMTNCCEKPLCSECYLQILPFGIPNKPSSEKCPWCRHENFSITYNESLRDKFENEITLYQEDSKQKLELEKEASKNEREEFERQRSKTIRKLLEIKKKEEEEGKYEQLKIDQEKNEERERIKQLFLEQKKNQEQTDKENIERIQQLENTPYDPNNFITQFLRNNRELDLDQNGQLLNFLLQIENQQEN